MTADSKAPKIVDNTPEAFQQKAQTFLSVPEYNMLMAYIEKGCHPLAPDTAAAMFNLFLNGSDYREIHRLNKAFPYESILWASIKYNWHEQRDEYALNLHQSVAQKVMKAQLETTGFLSDLLVAANKKHGDRVRKYIQTGEEGDLGDSLSVDSLHSLLKIAEGIQKLTGQSNTVKVKTENTQNINVSVGSSGGMEAMDTETAAKVLSAIADSKRKRGEGV
jgi:hypothetical protein